MFQQRFDYLRLPGFIADNITLDPGSIKIGVGQNAIRKIFKVEDYDQFERMQISSLAQALQKNQKYDANIHTDDLLLRYLYANKFNIEASVDQLVKTSEIVFQPGFMQLDREVEQLYFKGALYIEGRTRQHIPCIVVSTKLVDDLALFERAAIILCAIIEDYMFYSGKVESWIAVIQTKDQSAYKMPLDKIFAIIKILQTCFPNTCDAIYILNATLSINLLWSQIEVEYISPITLGKIKFLKDKELPILSNQFHPEQLEQSLGGEKILQSFWPPDPNDYMYDQPPQQQQPFYEYEEQPQVYFSDNNNLQYMNEAPILHEEIPPPIPVQKQPESFQEEVVQNVPEKKKKCICVKCSRDLENLNSQPRQRQPSEPQPVNKPIIPQQEPQKQVPQQLNDTYVPYERRYDSFINDTSLLIPKTMNDTIQQDNKEEQQFGGNSFNNSQFQQLGQQPENNQKPNKPSFTNPFYNADSMQGSQKIEPKQPPVISNKVSQEIQANMDDTIIDDKPDYQPKYVSKHSRPQQSSNFNHPSQSSRLTNNNPNLYNFQNIPSYNPINYAQYSQQPAQSSQYIPTLQTQPQSQQYINLEPQFQKIEVIQQQPVQVQEFDNTNYNPNQSYYAPQLSNDPKKKYDFSQWDKYNDANDTVPMQPYVPISNTYTSPYVQQSPSPNYNLNEDYNKMYDTGNDYKPGEFRPSTYNFTPYDYRYSDQQQFQPNATKEDGTQQLYQQKPGQQACQIF
ncbi:unnamed protein product (macronuclear) [Paramecium tetraurelia]|uniref:CRAL/TRIO N-terminal domain-containing protein n=1 Tax=Paramecium tetraurelia TaxID=5888 RepID=A0E6G8_PARTE|nr:uncharacterized protein GSPATT00003750001 [Paramecium tetraurelia]CAK90885.1 unnamed protein product [Paramecium tetraurelia]|eukprot:XP_001458282.1 hypothetical protein (macronuclear) [Paramecium tetraurelia strain d4-2]